MSDVEVDDEEADSMFVRLCPLGMKSNAVLGGWEYKLEI
jgi:hypothetical protein